MVGRKKVHASGNRSRSRIIAGNGEQIFYRQPQAQSPGCTKISGIFPGKRGDVVDPYSTASGGKT